jgi:hypothetical protein
MAMRVADITGGKQVFENGTLLLTILISHETKRVRLMVVSASGDIRFRGVINQAKLDDAVNDMIEMEKQIKSKQKLSRELG